MGTVGTYGGPGGEGLAAGAKTGGGATGAVMPRKFGGPNRQWVEATSLITCGRAIKDR